MVVQLVCPGAAAAQEDSRAMLGEDRARAMEFVVGAAFPNATLDWERETLHVPGQAPRGIALIGFKRVPFQGGHVVASVIQFPARIKEAAARLLSSEGPVDLGDASTRLAVVWLSSTGAAIHQKATLLDSDALISECRRLSVVTEPGGSGLVLQVVYKSTHRGQDWLGSVEWSATFNSRTLVVQRKSPIGLWRRASGGREFSDILEMKRLDPTNVELTGRVSGRKWNLGCGDPCIIAPEVILGLP